MTNSSKRHPRPRRDTRRPAFTLAEAAVSIVIVGSMLVVALNMVSDSARARQVNAYLGKAPALAHDLMSEILQARYQEPDAWDDVESAEGMHDSSVIAGSSLTSDDVLHDKWWGQHFKPTLPDDAVAWSVNKVYVHVRQSGTANGLTRVQFQQPDASFLPSGILLRQGVLVESTLPLESEAFTWVSVPFTPISGLRPDEGLCLVIVTDDKEPSMELNYFGGSIANLPDAGLLTSVDGGTSWELTKDKALRFMVYGTITTPADAPPMGLDDKEDASPREDFDDVDDYVGWTASPPQQKDGTELSDYEGWTRAVEVEYVDPSDVSGSAVGSDQGAKRITVTVTDPRGAQTVLVGIRGTNGSFEREPVARKSYVSWVGVELQLGEADASLSVGTALVNEPVVPGCGQKNDPCDANDDCCSGICNDKKCKDE